MWGRGGGGGGGQGILTKASRTSDVGVTYHQPLSITVNTSREGHTVSPVPEVSWLVSYSYLVS